MKIKIITGKRSVGKSTLAKDISLGFEDPLFISPSSNSYESPFFFENVSLHTDLIVIDEVNGRDICDYLELFTGECIRVEKRGFVGFEIPNPQIIIIVSDNFKVEFLPNYWEKFIDVISVSQEPIYFTREAKYINTNN